MHISRSLITIAIVTSCVVVACAVWGVYGWMVIQTNASAATVTQLISTRDTTSAKITYSESLRSLLRDTEADRTALAAVSTLSAVDVVDRIHTLSSDAGVDVTIESIAPGILDPAIAANASALSLTMSAKGTYAHLYRLLQLIETMPLPLIVDQVSFERVGEGADASWSMRTRVFIYTENAQ